MDDILGNLRKLKKELEASKYEIDHYEIREHRADYNLENVIGKETDRRASGTSPLKVLAEWESIDSEDYVIEVFLGGKNPLDRVIYDPEIGESEYIGFDSKNDEPIDKLLEIEE